MRRVMLSPRLIKRAGGIGGGAIAGLRLSKAGGLGVGASSSRGTASKPRAWAACAVVKLRRAAQLLERVV